MKVEYIDHLGTDLTVVNAARCSFSKQSDRLDDKDRGLIRFLARGCMSKEWDSAIDQMVTSSPEEREATLKWVKNMPTHWAPFAHPQITLRCTVPIFVARQDFKHQIGFVRSETSRRYVDDTPEFHVPTEWRSRPEASIKQGSGTDLVTHLKTDHTHFINEHYDHFIESAVELYEEMIESGVAPEQARMILPQSMLTTYWVTGSLYAWANAYIQRSDSHAQEEIRGLAKQWDEIIAPLYPVSWAALTR